jgi:hypothetical protein
MTSKLVVDLGTNRASIKARLSPMHRHSGDASGDASYNILAQNGLHIFTVLMQFWAGEGLLHHCIATPCDSTGPAAHNRQL